MDEETPLPPVTELPRRRRSQALEDRIAIAAGLLLLAGVVLTIAVEVWPWRMS